MFESMKNVDQINSIDGDMYPPSRSAATVSALETLPVQMAMCSGVLPALFGMFTSAPGNQFSGAVFD